MNKERIDQITVQIAQSRGAHMECETLILNGKDAHDFILSLAIALATVRGK
jgi:hypothetical protein